jgi:hypothetical protein
MTWDENRDEIQRTLNDWQDDRTDVRLTADPDCEKYADLEVDVKSWHSGNAVLFTWFVRLRKTPPSRPGYSDDQWEFETSEDCWADSGDLWQALFWAATNELIRARVAQK